MVDIGHWQHALITEGVNETPFGFVYKITNKTNGMMYIGKKQCLTTRKKAPLKGKKNKRHVTVETDWKTYTSSSRRLNEDIDELGKDNFRFEILMFGDSKWQLSYEEAKIQFEERVLLRDDYYNDIINIRLRGKREKSV